MGLENYPNGGGLPGAARCALLVVGRCRGKDGFGRRIDVSRKAVDI